MRKIGIVSIVVFLASAGLFTYCVVEKNKVIDKNGPKIQIESEEIEMSINDPEEILLEGVTAYDSRDGDVTGTLVVENISNFIETGRRRASLVAFDSDMNITRATRDLVYTDYYSPVFSLTSPLSFDQTSSDIMKGLSAEDCLDGDITDRISVSYNEEISSDIVGEYSVTYSVSNSAGDVSRLPVTIEYYGTSESSQRPKLELSDYLIYIRPGESIDPWQYLMSVTINGERFEKSADGQLVSTRDEEEILPESRVEIDNPVKNQAGVYEIVYQTDDKETGTGKVRLIVVVQE